MDDKVTLNHGSGGSLTGKLIRELFVSRFGMTGPLGDSAVVKASGRHTAFTTDSYVVDPLFFPGGDIGKLSVCGTVNDLSVAGAIPGYLSASFIIEDGFPVAGLEKIADSMASEARKAGVRIVAGDTKVVEKGKCDGLFITTTGIGEIRQGCEEMASGAMVRQGDKLIINGPVGNHSLAVLGARKKLDFRTPVFSDCASLNGLIGKILDKCSGIHFMRDVTRGGLATIANELSSATGLGINIIESSIPVDEPVRGLCEMLGFDPLFMANEGKVLVVAGKTCYRQVLDIMKSDPLGEMAAVIGEVSDVKGGKVILETVSGGRRILDMPSGIALPRIC